MTRHLDKHLFQMNAAENNIHSLRVAFDRTHAEIRKGMIASPPDELTGRANTLKTFVHNELIQFFISACSRGLPSMMDGFKPSQRKAFYTLMVKMKNEEVKVAQLAPIVAKHTNYHHGENSLNQTIINMARDFVRRETAMGI